MANFPLSLRLEGVDDVVSYYAELKGVPLADVLRHAGNDIAYGAYLATPTAAVRGKSRFALLPGRGRAAGKSVYVNLDTEAERERNRKHRVFRVKRKKSNHLSRLNQYRLASPARGFAKSVFIPLFKSLGFSSRAKDKPKAGDEANFAKYRRGFSIFATSRNPYSGDAFKMKTEQYRRVRMHSLEDYTAGQAPKKGDTSPNASFAIEVTEPALDNTKHSSWARSAAAAGFARAGGIIAKDLKRVLSSKHPASVKIDN